MFRDELANIENRILEKKIAEKKKEELRKKNIAVRSVNKFDNVLTDDMFTARCMETPREPRGFINKIQMLRRRRNYFQIQNLPQVTTSDSIRFSQHHQNQLSN